MTLSVRQTLPLPLPLSLPPVQACVRVWLKCVCVSVAHAPHYMLYMLYYMASINMCKQLCAECVSVSLCVCQCLTKLIVQHWDMLCAWKKSWLCRGPVSVPVPVLPNLATLRISSFFMHANVEYFDSYCHKYTYTYLATTLTLSLLLSLSVSDVVAPATAPAANDSY